jgi:thiamine-phosphate pyrophosphorylase
MAVRKRRPGQRELRERLAVYYVADPEQTERAIVPVVKDALAGGTTAVQLRAKQMPSREMYELGRELRLLCQEAGVLFFINDRVDVAVACEADGVHVGVHDLPLDATRRLIGSGMILGYSPLNLTEVSKAREWGADYVGLGPVYATGSKADAQEPLGPTGLAEQVAAARLPSVGIGGISLANAGEVIRAGVDGVAVISAIQGTAHPRQAAESLALAVNLAKTER